MRRLDPAKIEYKLMENEVDENDLSGTHIAEQIGLACDMVFKTLVAKGDKTGVVVFCIPVDKEIDLKAAATATNNKRVELVAVKELLGLTGYIRGGCSPIGMKKNYPIYMDITANDHPEITVSAGVRGAQLLISSEKLVSFVGATLCPLTY